MSKRENRDLVKQMLILKLYKITIHYGQMYKYKHLSSTKGYISELRVTFVSTYQTNKREDNLSLLNFIPLWQEDVVTDAGGRLSHHCMN